MKFTMKYSALILTGLAALAIGFLLAWLIKPSAEATHPAPTEEHAAHAQAFGSEIWTCSMHPQIKLPEPGPCPICEMPLIPLKSQDGEDPLVLKMSQDAMKLAQIETTVVGAKARGEKSLTLSGKIQADERLAASQVAHIAGRIEKLYVTFTGETVRKGQKVASLYSPELVTAQQELLQALKWKDTNPSLLKAARKKLSFWKISPEKIAQIESSGQIQETFTLTADASGVVTGRKVAVGDYVQRGQVLFDIVGLYRLWVLFDAYEADLAHIQRGDQIAFSTPALPTQSFTTTVSFIDPVINPATRVATVRGEIQNRSGQLKPEMFVKGTLQMKSNLNEQLLVPKSAVLWTGKRSVVYLKVPESNMPAFRYQEIELGERIGDAYLVEAGLESGDEVVTQGSFAIDAEAQLNHQASMMYQALQTGDESMSAAPTYAESTPEAFKQQLTDLAQAYISLKDALVATDAAASAQASQSFVAQLSKVDMSLVKGEAHTYWMQQLEALKAHGENIAKTEEVEEQRKQFGFLSTALIHTIQAFGLKGDTLYVQHCPMAFDFQGADWISLEEEIRNPYFGDQMMSCGEVTLQLQETSE